MALPLLHLLLHIAVPGIWAWLTYRKRWRRAWLIMLATMAVDIDHLLAVPIYSPDRCGMGLHPLHTLPAVAVYALMLLHPRLRLVGAGLVIHMALDSLDCLRMF